MRNSTIPTAPQRIRHWAIAAIAAIVAAVWVTMSLIVPSLADNSSPSPATPATAKAQEVALHPTVRAPQGLTEGFYLGLAKEPASQPSMMVLPKGGGSLTTPSFRLQLTRPGQSAPASALCADPETESSTENNSTYVVSARDKSIVGFVNLDNAVQQKYVAATPNNRDADAELQKQYQALSALYDKNPAPTGYSNFENLVWQAVVWKMYYGMSVDERIPAGSGSSKGLTPGHFAIDLANAEKFTDKVNELHKQAVEDAKDLQTNKEMLDSIKLTIADGEPGHKLVKLDGSPQAVKAMNDALETKLNPEPADLGITITVDGKEPIKGTVKQALNGGIDVPLECGPSNTVKMTAQWNGKILLDGIFSGHADYKTQAGKNTQTKVVLGSETVPLTASQTFDALCAVPSSEDNPPVVRTTAAAADGTKNVVVDQDTTITDTVDLSDLVPGTSYQLTGKLIDKATGQPVTGVAEPKSEAFTAKATTDTQTMTFNVPAKSIGAADADKQYVVFEYLTQVKGVPPADSSKDNTVVARHESKDDEAQTVTVPKWAVPPEIQIQTQAKTPTPLKAGEAGEIVDDVTMAGLVKDQSYTLKGTLMDKATKQPVPGVDVVTSQPFVAKGETAETQPMTFKLPAEAVKGGATYVVFEELFDSKNNSVAEHKEIDSPEQSVTIEKPQAPTLTVKTTASTPTPLEVGKAGTVVDKVDMTGLVKDAKYTLTGTLVDKETGEPVAGTKADPKEFTAEGETGTQTMEFTVPADAVVAGKSFVVFETLTPASPDQKEVKHDNKDDEAQTVTVPTPTPKEIDIHTTATGPDGKAKEVPVDEATTIIDTVKLDNLVKGTQYKLTGTLVDKTTGQPVEGVKAEPKEFTATGDAEQTQTMTFTVPAKSIGAAEGEKQYVVFEELTQVKAPEGGDASKDGTVVKEHKDKDDEAQTVTVPKWAVPPDEPQVGGFDVTKVVKAPEGVTVPESFTFTYTCAEGTAPAADAKWTDLTVKPGEAGKQKVENIPVGQTCWLREKAADIEGATHAVTWTGNGAEVGADNGTIAVPIEANTSFAVVATNTYTKPTPGKVTVSKRLVDQTEGNRAQIKEFSFPYVCATGSAADTKVSDGTLTIQGEGTNSIENVPAGAVCVVGETDADMSGADQTVAWTVDGTVATPSDITWGGQEIKGAVKTKPAEGGVEAQIVATNTYVDKTKVGFTLTKNLSGSDSALLKDQQFSFHYACGDKTGDFKLKPDETFSSIEQNIELAKGTQCTVTEQKPADVEGVNFKGVTFDRISGEGDFTSSEADSSVTFTLTAAIDPQTFRATNSYKPTEQPKEPDAKTVLGTVDGGKVIDAAKVADDSEVELVDTVSYTNLKADTDYVAEGNITTAAGEATAFATFTTGHGTDGYANGDVKVTFKVPAAMVTGSSQLTALERIWEKSQVTIADHKVTPNAGEKPVAKHEVPDDKDQTVTIKPKPDTPPTPKTPTVKTTASTPQPLEVGKAGTVVDKVEMTGLVKDAKYTLTGTLVDQTTGEPVPGAKAEPKEFTAEGDASTQTMEFSVPAEAVVADKSFVVFETLTPASPDQPKVDHADKNDKAQTVTVPKPDQPKTPTVKTNATNKADDTQVVDGEKDATIVDKVTMTNLVKGTQYKLTGTLVDQTGIPVEGVAPVESEPFEATGEGEEVQSLEFTIPAKVLGSKDAETKYVVFEELTQVKAPEGGDASKDGTVVADHKDVNDEAQTVTVPKWAVPPEEPEYGGFDVSKVVKAPEGVTAPESYAFTYTCGEGDEPAADAEWTDLTVTPGDAGKQTVDKIPAGQTCWLREKAADIEGTTHAVTWTGNGTDLKDEKGTVSFPIEANASFAVVATNTYTLPTPGKVTVSKAVEDNTSKKLAADKSFTFPYVCATGEGADTKISNGDLTVAAGESASIENLPAGAVCVIGEADAAIDGTAHAVAWTADGTAATPADVTWGGQQMKDAVKVKPVEAGLEVKVGATNTYQDEGAVGFSVTKRLQAPESAILKGQTFEFTYTCGDQTGDFTVKSEETFSSIEQGIKLADGTQCTVAEKKPAPVDGVNFDGVTFDRVSGEGDFSADKDHSQVTFTVKKAKTPLTFTATNVFTPTDEPKLPNAKTVLGTVDGGKEIDAAKVADGTEVELVDTITYENLKADTKYVAEGNITTTAGGAFAYATFTTDHGTDGYANGDVKVTFKVPAAMVTGSDKLTAFERIWPEDKVTIDNGKVTPKNPNDQPDAKHEVPDDKDQTVTIKPKPDTPPVTPTPKTPEVSTSAGVSGGAVLVPGQDGTVVDQVSLSGLTVGTHYQVTGVLMDKATGKAVDGVTAEPATFTATAETGQVTITFKVPGSAIKADSSLVVFETLTQVKAPEGGDTSKDGKPVADHKDINDHAQTVTVPKPPQPGQPEVSTLAKTPTPLEPGTDGKVVDQVTMTGLVPGTQYQVTGVLMDKATNQPVEGATADPVTFTAEKATEQHEVTFTVPGDRIKAGASYVVFETLTQVKAPEGGDTSKNNQPVADHKDINDHAQTVTVPKPDQPTPKTPEVSTSAGVPGGAVLIPGQDGTVVDKVTMTDLTPGTQYKVTGILMDKATNTAVPGVTSEPVTFTADAATKVLDMTFHVPGSAIKAGSSLVVFETLTQVKAPEGGDTSKDNQPVAKHHDINDHAQTVTIPKPNTPGHPAVSTLASVPGGALLVPGQDGTVVDKVTMTGLVPGTTYQVSGVLMDKATNKAVPGATSEPVEFTAEAASQVVDVTFTVPGDQIKAGASMVVFETLTQVKAPEGGDTANNGKPVADHKDINDRKQTVTVPKPGAIIPELPSITTTAAGDGLTHGQALPAGVDGVIHDKVFYGNFEPGRYVVVGEVMDKSTGKVVPGSYQKARAEFEVKGEADASGSLVVTFHVPASQMRPGAQFVIFERVYRAEDVKGINGLKPGVKPIVEDVDLANASETVVVAMAKTKGTTPVTPVPGGGTTTTHTVWHRMLARTGASAGLVGGVACAVIVAGCGLVLLRRRDA